MGAEVNGTKVPGTGRELLPAYLVCACVALAGVVWGVLALTHLDAATRYQEFDYAAQYMMLGLGFALSGMVFVARGSGTVFGWFLLAAGATAVLCFTLQLTIWLGLMPRALAGLAFFSGMVFFTLFLTLLYTQPLWLPDGRLGGRWARWYTGVMLALAVVQQAYRWSTGVTVRMDITNPMSQGAWADFWAWTSPVMGPFNDDGGEALVGLAVLLTVVRVLSSSEYRRLTYWVNLPYLAWCAQLLLVERGLISDGVRTPLAYAAAASWPVALAFVHVRARTWALDRGARRVLTVLLLTLLMMVVCTAAVALVLSFAPHHTNAAKLLPALALGLVVGLLLRPVSRGASYLVDRWFYGSRAQPYQVVRDLSKALSQAVEPGDTPQLLAGTVVHTLGLPAASVTVDGQHGPHELVRVGDPGPRAERFPIRYRGQETGRLDVAPRPGELTLDPQDREAVQVLAQQAGPALASLRLYRDLRSSREQIVHTREEERRRLRHELHDGLGPALSGLRLQVDAVRRGAGPHVAEPLCGVSEGIGYAIKELRHITDGLAPAALDGADLARALRRLSDQLSSRSLRISVAVEPDPLPPLPAALQVAVYRITAEALNNVVRHSHADRARALVTVADGRVGLRITDNGDGFPAHEHCAGVGLRSMAERSEELGGAFSLTSDGAGTVVEAAFPAEPGTTSGQPSHAAGTAGGEDS
ncbi:histidine kinase [Streptomyces niveiscabiei]|uniref:GAF domain-containing sensor histidine kinase n=1 Tax=Streptomyces niveiscabiei TaxID=164115 RepID=UPI0029A174AE|nr:ATP-binding protein [Streptomyces niveiscabiei]MDX3382228.1 histidine kinase [Streptomyces niveiscabiei]